MKTSKKYKMKKIKKVVIFVTLIFLLSQVYLILGIPTLGVFKVNTCVELKQTCANCSYVNLTSIIYPDSTSTVINMEMTKDGSVFNYTFCNNTLLGTYIVNGIGNPQGVQTIFAYDYSITTTGNSSSYTIPLFIGIGAFVLLIFAFLLQNNYMGFITGVLFIVLGIYLLVYGLGVMSDFYTQTIAYVALGFGLLIFLASSYSAINETGVNLFRKNSEEEDESLED
jgi:hypothetical protein